jgi:hypothetical protein
MSINQALHCLKGMSDGGWLAKDVSNTAAFSQLPLAQFYTFSFGDQKSFVTALSIDNFLSNVTSFNQLPQAHLAELTGVNLASEVARLVVEVEKNTQGAQKDLSMALNAYMLTTKAGQLYFNSSLGRPFAFVAILYPSNKEQTKFTVRPFIMRTNEVISTKHLSVLAKEVAAIDLRNGHDKYFEFITK